MKKHLFNIGLLLAALLFTAASQENVSQRIDKILEAEVSEETIEQIKKIDPTLRKSVPYLTNLILQNEKAKKSIHTLNKLDPHWNKSNEARAVASKLLKKFQRAISHYERDLLFFYVWCLGEMERAAYEAIPDLLRAYSEDHMMADYYWVRNALDKILPGWQKSQVALDTLPEMILIASAELHSSQYKKMMGLVAEIDPNWKTSAQVKKLIPQLIKNLKTPHRFKANQICEILNQIDPHWKDSKFLKDFTPTLLEALRDSAYFYASGIATAVSHIGEKADPKFAPLLVAAIEEEKFSHEKSYVVDALVHFPSQAEIILPALSKAIDSESHTLQSSGILALKKMKHVPSEVIQKVIKKLNSDAYPSYAALEILGDLQSKECVPYVAKFLKHEHRSYRKEAAKTLSKIGQEASAATPSLLQMLETEEDSYSAKKFAALALWKIGYESLEINSQLVTVYHSSDPDYDYIRKTLDDSKLQWLTPSVIENSILKLIYSLSEEYYRSEEILQKLNKIDPNWKQHPAVKKLVIELVKDFRSDNFTEVWNAIRTINYAEIVQLETVPSLIYLLDNRDERIVNFAVDILARMGSKAKPATEKLIKLLRHDYSSTGEKAWQALNKIDPNWSSLPETQKMIPWLSDGLQNNGWYRRRLIVDVFTFMGPNAKKAVPALVDSLTGEINHDWYISALNKIDPEWQSLEITKDAIQKCIAKLEDEKLYNDKYALKSISVLGSKSEIPVVINFIENNPNYPNLRVHVLQALIALKDKNIINRIRSIYPQLSSSDQTDILKAILAEKEISSKFSITELLNFSGDDVATHIREIINSRDQEEVISLILANWDLISEENQHQVLIVLKDSELTSQSSSTVIAKLAILGNNKANHAAVQILKKTYPEWYRSKQVANLIPNLIKGMKQPIPKSYRAYEYLSLVQWDDFHLEGNEIQAFETELLNVLDSPSWFVRYAAAKALSEIKFHHDLPVEKVLPLLKDSIPEVRAYAAKIFGKLGQAAQPEESKEYLLSLCIDTHWLVRDFSLNALNQSNPKWFEDPIKPKIAISFLQALESDNKKINKVATEKLRQMDLSLCQDQVIQYCLQLPKDQYESGNKIARALKTIKNVEKHIIPGLVKKTYNDKENAFRVTSALEKIDTVPLDCLLQMATNKDVTFYIARIFQERKIKHEKVIQFFLAMLDGPEENHFRAFKYFKILGDDAKPIIPRIVAAFDDKEYFTRLEAVKTIGVLGSLAQEEATLPLILLMTQNREIGEHAEKALDQVFPKWSKSKIAQNAIPEIIIRLVDNRGNSHQRTLKLLNHINPNWYNLAIAKKHLPRLIESLFKLKPTNQKEFFLVLKKIDRYWMYSKNFENICTQSILDIQRANNYSQLWRADERLRSIIPTIKEIISSSAENSYDKEVRIRISSIVRRLESITKQAQIKCRKELKKLKGRRDKKYLYKGKMSSIKLLDEIVSAIQEGKQGQQDVGARLE